MFFIAPKGWVSPAVAGGLSFFVFWRTLILLIIVEGEILWFRGLGSLRQWEQFWSVLEVMGDLTGPAEHLCVLLRVGGEAIAYNQVKSFTPLVDTAEVPGLGDPSEESPPTRAPWLLRRAIFDLRGSQALDSRTCESGRQRSAHSRHLGFFASHSLTQWEPPHLKQRRLLSEPVQPATVCPTRRQRKYWPTRERLNCRREPTPPSKKLT